MTQKPRIIWFEHMYQPAWNFEAYGTWDPKRMIDECYRPNAEFMKKCGVKIAMNITQTMYDFFKLNDALDVLEIYRELGAQIEYVGSTAHHVLCIDTYRNVLSEELREQRAFLKHYFGQEPKFFFPPEMAIDQTTEHRISEHGYVGMITSGGAPNFETNETTGVFESTRVPGLTILAHNNYVSAQFAFPVNGFSSEHDLRVVLESLAKYELPVVFAFDHESFGGYHNPRVLEMKKQFFNHAKSAGWEFCHPSDMLDEEFYGKVELNATTWVGSYEKWDHMPDRWKAIIECLSLVNGANSEYLRKWVLPSCHLHIDYATDKFWDYIQKARDGNENADKSSTLLSQEVRA